MALYTALFYCNEKETEPYCFKTTIYPIYQIVKKFKEIYNLDFLTIMYEVCREFLVITKVIAKAAVFLFFRIIL